MMLRQLEHRFVVGEIWARRPRLQKSNLRTLTPGTREGLKANVALSHGNGDVVSARILQASTSRSCSGS